MTSPPTEPTVLNTTVPSNFAYIDRIELLSVLPRVCTVPAVQNELRSRVDSYPYLQRALDGIGETISLVDLTEQDKERAAQLENRLDRGESQAFAVANGYGGTLVTDDGPARTLARSNDVPLTGSIGVLIRAVENNRISKDEADHWLKQWIDETDYRAPSRDFSDYR
jgi:predicted nucleic acid-binding protein